MNASQRDEAVAALRTLPAQLRELTSGLSDAELTTPFLAGEWSVAQNVHHVADSHLNAYTRMKLLLTEAHPTIRPYDQDAWALLPEANDPDLTASLKLLEGLHQRWATMLERLPNEAWERSGLHPESGTLTIDGLLSTYVAHGLAHIDQIQRTLAAREVRP